MIKEIGIPKGTRDFLPEKTLKRNYIFSVIRKVFELHGFLPLETPAMENLNVLTGKYGEEGDRLIFKILNSGDYMKETGLDTTKKITSDILTGKICEKALRYDLTVPFARLVTMHQNEIFFPFKRYQIQPVWRADKPQKGRYREFVQCDADVIGSDGLLNEAELIQIIAEVFYQLGIDVTVKLNNRKILAGIAGMLQAQEYFTVMTTALDKLEKKGKAKVIEEMLQKGFPEDAAKKLEQIIAQTGEGNALLDILEEKMENSEPGASGIKEMRALFDYIAMMKLKLDLKFDITLARGLNYYTGTIVEVSTTDVNIGSLCGGGRYDDLTGVFGLNNVSGVGISFGADRIYDVLETLNKFPENIKAVSEVIIINFGEKEMPYAFAFLNRLRAVDIKAEVYPDPAKIKKQMNYANRKQIPFVILLGSEEIKQNEVTIKEMKTGKQVTFSTEKAIDYIKNAKKDM